MPVARRKEAVVERDGHAEIKLTGPNALTAAE